MEQIVRKILVVALAAFILNFAGGVAHAQVTANIQAVNVRAMGAVGDGVTDDCNAIQQAINWAQANNGAVYVQNAAPNFYLCNLSTLSVTGPVRIFGDSAAVSEIRTTNNALSLLSVAGVTGFSLSDVKLNSTGGASTGTGLVISSSSVSPNIERVSITGFSQGINLIDTAGPSVIVSTFSGNTAADINIDNTATLKTNEAVLLGNRFASSPSVANVRIGTTNAVNGAKLSGNTFAGSAATVPLSIVSASGVSLFDNAAINWNTGTSLAVITSATGFTEVGSVYNVAASPTMAPATYNYAFRGLSLFAGQGGVGTYPGVGTQGAQLWSNGSGVRLDLIDLNQMVDSRVITIRQSGAGIRFEFRTDANVVGGTPLILSGNGAGVTSITSNSGSGAWTHTGSFNVTGSSFLGSGSASDLQVSGGASNPTISASSGNVGMGSGLFFGSPATLSAAFGSSGPISNESPVLRWYIGDGTGYSWRLTKRTGSVSTDYFTVTDNGIITATGELDTPSINVNGDGAQSHLASGTYTPTFTNGPNVSASTARVSQYLRVGNTVTVSGSFQATSSVALNNSTIDATIPVSANNFSNAFECAGTLHADTGASGLDNGLVRANVGTQKCTLQWEPVNTNPHEYYFSFTMKVN